MSIYPKVYRNREQSELVVHGQALEDMTKDDLYQMAQDQDIEGRSSMTKDELIEALS